MATSLGIATVLGLLANTAFTRIKLPGLLGMLLLGIAIGPFGLNWLTPELMAISADLRKIALIVILLRAGLGISRQELAKVGSAAIRLSCVPGILEGFTIAVGSMAVLGFSFVEGGILGFIIAAVSPAVIVPQMLRLSEEGLGTDKGIPTLILAGASIDDVFAITLFTTFLGFYGGSRVNLGWQIASIPVSILLGIGLGWVCGRALVWAFRRWHMRDTKKVLYIIGVAIMLTTLEQAAKPWIEIASLLGVMTIGYLILERRPVVAQRLAAKFAKVWVFAEILLFVLVGAQVNIGVALDAGLRGLALIAIGLLARSVGVWLSTLGAGLNVSEKLFCMVAYIPKATVQAAIGAIPLATGVASGEVMLAVAVLAILVTAPLGALGIDLLAPRLLNTEEALAPLLVTAH
jgi:NhaP-type Na+/H+ or K+/H+ antiporter